MPTLTITVWNIQDYGVFRYTTRGSYTAVHNFIAWVLLRQQADIFMMVEMQQTGTLRLPNLRAALATRMPGANWFYDWVKGAIDPATAPGPNTGVTTFGQLGFTQSAKREGYALFFRNNPAKFSMTQAAPVGAAGIANTLSAGVQPAPVPLGVPTYALSVVLEGRPPAAMPTSPWAYTAPNFNPAVAPPVAWNNLNFPTPVSPNLIRASSRRPAYCVIRLNIGGGAGPAATLMPLMVYHAPSNGTTDNAPPAGTQAASFARALYQVRDPAAGWAWVNNTHALACGDFNVNGNSAGLPFARQLSYTSYLSPFANSGAGMTQSAIPMGQGALANNTALSLTQWIGGPPKPNGASWTYATAEFDNIFTRGIPGADIRVPPRGVIYDLITAVRPGGSLTGVPVTNFLPLVNARIANKAMVNGRPVYLTGAPVYPQITNWANFYNGLTAGQFPNNRSAAEFITLFVSDHLPVTFRFDY
ncbi:hypothetical protein A176_005261 [Myxococcus hansupus]|uniref:Endonuclease/exonuclease/phosphatase domain-containing protein n=1 Tax=Pseudomyxococcus hansupus TaxID=1297742 RepID=A0A0H4WZU7_9BACT|nr:hypothetical protein [Myxococcus hansupus]AKQ68349.1 hypothetical protein A176_005261 [Myxococcus hansupus]